MVNSYGHDGETFLNVRVAETLKQAGVDLVCLAGFMRLVKAPLLDAFPSKILNIHPSLLPAFPGVAAWAQAVGLVINMG